MSKIDGIERSFEKNGTVGTILKFSIPSSVGTVVGMLCVLTDRYFIGQVAGRAGMSAVAIVFPYAMIINSINFLFAGIAINVGIKLGEKRRKSAEKVLGSGFFWLILVGGLLTITLAMFNHQILSAFGATGKNMEYALEYTKFIIPIVIFQMILGQSTVIRGIGDPVTAMGVNIFTALLNVVLDYLFIIRWNMGIGGASLATFIANVLSALYVVVYFLKSDTLKLRFRYMKPDLAILKDIVKIGSPRFYNQLLQSLLVIVTNKKAGIYGGDIATAAIGIISIVRNFINTSMMGFNQGTAAIISYNYGAGKIERVKEVVKVQIKIVATISTLLVLTMLLFTDFYSSFFVKDDIELIKFTSNAMRLNLFMMTFT
ncbi:MAG: MATE family efflux transporter, partial [Fusobacteriaceae bacterium]